jgi:hypothetical protein
MQCSHALTCRIGPPSPRNPRRGVVARMRSGTRNPLCPRPELASRTVRTEFGRPAASMRVRATAPTVEIHNCCYWRPRTLLLGFWHKSLISHGFRPFCPAYPADASERRVWTSCPRTLLLSESRPQTLLLPDSGMASVPTIASRVGACGFPYEATCSENRRIRSLSLRGACKCEAATFSQATKSCQ